MKRWIASLLALALLCGAATAAAAPDARVQGAYDVQPFRGGLAIFTTMGDFRCGLMDEQGRVTLEPAWDNMAWISDRYLAVYTHDACCCGVIDVTGAYVSPTQWDGYAVREGFTLLYKGGLYAILSADGRLLAEPTWVYVSEASEDVAIGVLPNQSVQYVNVVTGAVSANTWRSAEPFEGGYGRVYGNGAAYVDADFAYISEDWWDHASAFYHDRAAVQAGDAPSLLIDTQGETRLTQTDYDVPDVSYTPYFDTDMGVYGYQSGTQTVVEPRFRQAFAFSSGLARVQYREAFGFINPKGELTLANSWTSAEDFVGRYAHVKDGFCDAYLDKDGRLFPEYPMLYATTSDPERLVMRSGDVFYLADADMSILTQTGFAVIRTDAEADRFVVGDCIEGTDGLGYGLISRDGSVLLAPAWDEIGPFVNGVAKVRKGLLWGLMDTDGATVLEPKYNCIGDISLPQIPAFIGTTDEDGAPLVGKYGFITADGTELGKPSWDYAEPYACGLALVFSGTVSAETGMPLTGKFGYVNEAGETALPPLWERANSFYDDCATVRLAGEWSIITPGWTNGK